MSRYLATLVLFVAIGLWSDAHAATQQSQAHDTVVLIVCDGLRWQEVFTGADSTLLNAEEGGSWTPVPELRERFWADDVSERRRRLMPFLWGTVARDGLLYGNQTAGSVARVTNPWWFSYPGYNEMSTGVADPRIDKNEYGPNPNVTVFEWLNSEPDLKGRVEIFGTWSVFHDIFNEGRSGLPVRSGTTLVDRADRTDTGALLSELYQTTTRLEGEDPYDSFLHVALRRHLAQHQPRVLFVGFGDTDTFAHAGRYDLVLEGAHSFDAFVADLWRQMQSLPAYRGHTTFIVTTDHGRGSGPVEWKDHGVEQKGSDNIWIAVLGPRTPALGELKNTSPVTQSQIAATVAAAVGKDIRAFRPDAAPPLAQALSGQRR